MAAPLPPPLPNMNLLRELQKDLKQSEMIYNQISENFDDNPYSGFCQFFQYNQGLTNKQNNCYMNCILQTLFMNFDFTNNILHLSADCQNQTLIYQIQKLFAKMILKQQGVIETNEIAQSLQNQDFEIMEQQDAGEFFRVIANSVEQELKSTDLNELIFDLFSGLQENYIICENCQTKSSNQEHFTTQFLTVKDNFRKISNNSLEQCLVQLTEIEELKQDNKYFCSKCQEKQDAKKGTLINKFPSVCTFSLNRFILNFQTMKKQKLNDYVSFPFLINLNAFKIQNKSEKNKLIEQEKLKQQEQKKVTSIEQLLENQKLKAQNAGQRNELIQENIVKLQQEKISKFNELVQEDPNAELYELTSIIIHAGSLNSGHYFAYIQSIENHKWYKFSDKKVELVDINEIKEKAFGGSGKSCNAQLLFYNKLKMKSVEQYQQSVKNEIKIDKLYIIPETLLATIQDEEYAKSVQKQLELQQIQLQIIHNDDIKIIITSKTDTYIQLLKQTICEFELKEPIENCKLRFYNLRYNEKKHYLIDDDNEQKSLGELQLGWFTKLYLEVKDSHKGFESYDVNDLEIKVFTYKIALSQFDVYSEKIKINKYKTYKELREVVSILSGINENQLTVIIKQQEEASLQWVGRQLVPTQENLLKKLEELVVDQIFVEIQKENLLWISYFDNLNTLIEVKILNLTANYDENQPQQQRILFFSKTKTFFDLQQYLIINFDEELESSQFGFIINGKAGLKIKDNNQKLEIVESLENQISIYLDFGQVFIQPGEIYIDFYYAESKEFQDFNKNNFEEMLEYDKFLYNFNFLGFQMISKNFTPTEIISSFLIKLTPLVQQQQPQISDFRLREKSGNKLQKVYKNFPLISQQVFDRKSIAFEYLPNQLKDITFYNAISYYDHLVQFAFYDPEFYSLGKFQELIVSNQITYDQLSELIKNVLNVKCTLSGAAISNLNNFTRFLLYEATWDNFDQNNKKLIENPLELQQDGKLFVVRDSSKKLKQLSESQIILIQKHLWKENLHYNLI